MSDHLIDVVDEDNVPTGEQVLRSIAHEKNMWHRSAVIFVYKKIDDSYEFLIHLRSTSKDVSPDKLAPAFGGHVEKGETTDEAALNEIKEELNLDLSIDDLKKGPLSKMEVSNEFFQYYFLEYKEEMGDLSPNPKEIQSTEWMLIDDVLENIEHNPDLWTRTTPRAVEVMQTIQ